MPRGKVKIAYLERDSLRRKTFRQRSQCLMKKVEEISVLTGEQGCGIISSPDRESPIFWPPSPSDVMEVIQKFEHFCQIGKCKEMSTLDSCLSEMSIELEKQRMLELKEIRESEINYLMNSIFKHGMTIQNTLGYGQSFEILRYMDELSLKCQLKMHELKEEDGGSFQPVLWPRVNSTFEINGGMELAPPPSIIFDDQINGSGMRLDPQPAAREVFSNHFGMGEKGRDYSMHASSSNAAGVWNNQGLLQQQFGSTPGSRNNNYM